MAKNTTTQAAPVSTSNPGIKAEDIKNLAPQIDGFSFEDFETVGGLRPVVAPEVNVGKPIAGFVLALLDMPPRDDGSPWQALLVELVTPAKAKQGADIIEVEAGKDVLIPLSGSLKNNADLVNVAVDARKVTMAMFTVTGQQNTGKPSMMWVYDVKLALKKQVERTGKYALYNRPVAGVLENGKFSPAEVYDRNGQPVKSVIGNGQVATA